VFHVKPLEILLVNPHIYDFSAYAFWSAPIGLLYVGSILRKNGCSVHLLDCLQVEEQKRKQDGRGPFVKGRVEKPPPLANIPRNLRRYGTPPEVFRQKLSALEPPDLVLITATMTYWYLGAKEILDVVRDVLPRAKVVLGGIYPSLCYEHASSLFADADLVVRVHDLGSFYRFLEETFGVALPFRPSPYDLDRLPFPSFDLCSSIPFIPLLTSYGCAFRCAYCATPFMHPGIARRTPSSVLAEITHWQHLGVDRFVIYDDSFLYRKECYAKPLLESIARLPSPLRIYNPNAMNAAFIDQEVASLIRLAGFQEIRLGLETVNPTLQRQTGGKVDLETFNHAIAAINGAGFPLESVHVYIMAGLPNQRWEDVRRAVDYVLSFGAQPDIAEYTPIPHTRLFEQFHSLARFPIDEEPLFQNNALFPFSWEGFTENDLAWLKQYVRKHRGS
jgi:radical SAM superfamily enzyme YgiQ (UPF0313 family)